MPTAPAEVSRFLTGEQFEDGSFCIDHTYFQHNKNTYDSKVTQEIRYFDRDLLEDSRLIGPSHPRLCFHSKKVKKFNRIFKSVVSRFFENLWSDSL